MAKYKEYQAEVQRKRMVRWAIVIVMLALITFATVALAYVASRMLTGKPLFDETPQTDIVTNVWDSPASDSDGTTPPTPDEGEGEAPAQLPRYWNTLTPVAQTVNNVTIAADARMLALPVNGRVDYEYFRTALFIGDSLAQGFGSYPVLGSITNVAGFIGVGPREIIQNNIGTRHNGEKVAMWDFICQQTPMNIYITIGTNAMVAMPDDAAFLKYYGDMLDMLRMQFPNIPIYVQSITPVTQSTSDRRPTMSNERIRGLNNVLAVMAQEKNMYYVNLHELMADENGCLRADMAGGDGYHMRNNDAYTLWTDYLASHTAYNPYNVQFLTEPYNA